MKPLKKVFQMSVEEFFTPKRFKKAGVEIKQNFSRVQNAIRGHNISRNIYRHQSCQTMQDVVGESKWSWQRTHSVGKKTMDAMEKVLATADLKLR